MTIEKSWTKYKNDLCEEFGEYVSNLGAILFLDELIRQTYTWQKEKN